jgi:hypothetical protein
MTGVWIVAIWAIGLFILLLIRGYMEACHPESDFCDDDFNFLFVIWPIAIAFLIAFVVLVGPFWLARKLGILIGKNCGCGRY